MRDVSALDDVLARQAGYVRTGSADETAFDHDNLLALLRQMPGDVFSSLAAAENDVLDMHRLVHGSASGPAGANDSGELERYTKSRFKRCAAGRSRSQRRLPRAWR